MGVYFKESRLSADKVMQKALKFFSSKPLNLKLKDGHESNTCATFEGGDSFVTITVNKKAKGSEVNLETKEWDYWVKKFLESSMTRV